MLNLLFYSDCAPSGVGGTEWSVQRIAALLHESHAKVTIYNRLECGDGARFTLRKDNQAPIPTVTCVPSVFHVNGFDNRRFMEEMHRAILTHIRRARVDVVHIFGTGPGCFAAGTAAKVANVPFLLALRGSDLSRDAFDSRRHPHIDWLLAQSAARSFVSRELLEFATAVFAGMPSSRNYVVHNSTDSRWFSPCDVSPVARVLTGRVIGCVGPIREQMGFTWTLDVVSHILAKQQDVVLLIIGGPHEREHDFGTSMISTFQHQDKIIITGAIPHEHVLSYMSLCHVGLLLPRTEGCPNKVLEFMLAGVPVVAARIGAIPEIVQDGKSGLLVDPDDQGKVVAAVEQLLNNSSMRTEMGRQAKGRVLQQFNSRAEVGHILRIYNDLASARRISVC